MTKKKVKQKHSVSKVKKKITKIAKKKTISKTIIKTTTKKKTKASLVPYYEAPVVKKKRSNGGDKRKYLGTFRTEAEIARLKRKEELIDLFRNKDGKVVFKEECSNIKQDVKQNGEGREEDD